MAKSKKPGSAAEGRQQFGAELKRLREAQGKTQTAIAASLGKTPAWLSFLESGRRTLRNEDDVTELAKTLRANPTKLIGLWKKTVLPHLDRARGYTGPVIRRFPFDAAVIVEDGSDINGPYGDDYPTAVQTDHAQPEPAESTIDMNLVAEAIQNSPMVRAVVAAACNQYRREREDLGDQGE